VLKIVSVGWWWHMFTFKQIEKIQQIKIKSLKIKIKICAKFWDKAAASYLWKLFYVFVPGNDVLQFMIVWKISVSDVLTKNAFFSCKFASRCSLPQKIYMLWKKVYSLQLFRSILRRVFQMGILFGCAST
jgi:hypothetical protein